MFASDDLTGAGGDWDLESASEGDELELAAGLLPPIDLEIVRTFEGTLANTAPVADAGPDQIVYNDALVTLDGTASSDADIEATGGEFQVNTATAGKQDHPTLDSASDGSFVVVWRGDSSGSIIAQRYDADGAAIQGSQ